MTIAAIKPVFLYSDIVLWVVVACLIFYAFHARKTETLRAAWARVAKQKTALFCAGILALFFTIGLLDSLHYRKAIDMNNGEVVYSVVTESALDALIERRVAPRERSYSAPFAIRAFDKTTQWTREAYERTFERLSSAREDVTDANFAQKLLGDLAKAVFLGIVAVMLFGAAGSTIASIKEKRLSWWRFWKSPFALAIAISIFLCAAIFTLWPDWHPLGTDSTGNDVLFVAVKSIRTAFIIGIVSIASMLPFAIIAGLAAGYFRGVVDEVIQYIYTTISSIPSVLLIAACVLMIEAFIDKNPMLYETGLERADLRLLLLAVIMGVTGWASLARLLRAETMKLSSMEFIEAAEHFGLKPVTILRRHIFPNVTHIVLIVSVLNFSAIVLYEAILSYVGVGVDPSTYSFGSMINAASGELAKNPVVWWNLVAAFVFMVTLVLSANLFAIAVREAFDPRASS